MIEKIEEKLAELIGIADSVPEKYSVKCFELLLSYELGLNKDMPTDKPNEISSKPDESGIAAAAAASTPSQREVSESDLHLKFKQFLKKYRIDLEKINQLYYIEGDDFLPIYDDLKTVRSAETQIRLALFQAMINAMKDGSFEFDGEAVRVECQKRKAYDSSNFSANFKNNASLFDGFSSYKKDEQIRLSEQGKEELNKLIQEISE